jgi:ribosomal protein S27AE
MGEIGFKRNTFMNVCGHEVDRSWKLCPICGAEVILDESTSEKLARLEKDVAWLKKEM